MNSLLQIENLAVGHRNKVLLSGITFHVDRGELIALVGRNGSGKTTLLKTICGLQPMLAGNIILETQPISSLSPRQIARHISIVLTQKIILQGISVRTLVEMGRYPAIGRFHFSNATDTLLVDECLSKIGIDHLAEKSLAEISDGELQKAMIARALVQKTLLILMDEPTAFLDYVAKEELFDLLQRLVKNEGISIIFSSHDLELVRKYATRILKISNGNLGSEL